MGANGPFSPLELKALSCRDLKSHKWRGCILVLRHSQASRLARCIASDWRNICNERSEPFEAVKPHRWTSLITRLQRELGWESS